LHVSYAMCMVRHTMMNHTLSNLADQIRKARGNRSQQVFATELGTNMMTLREWENGNKPPHLHRHVVALADEGVPMELLTAAVTPQVAS
jgi:transcriptional regulator with XRE-family HTH domain